MGSILKKVSCFIYRFNSDLSELTWKQIAEVTTDGTKTFSQMLSSLWTQVDSNLSLSKEYLFIFKNNNDEWRVPSTRVLLNNRLIFTEPTNDGNGAATNMFYVNSTGVYESASVTGRVDYSSNKPVNGAYMQIYERKLK